MLSTDDVVNMTLGYVFSSPKPYNMQIKGVKLFFLPGWQSEFSCMMEEGMFRSRVIQRHGVSWRSFETAAVGLRRRRPP